MELDVHEDKRGQFAEMLPASLIGSPIVNKFVPHQINVSVSSKGVLRGMHCVRRPPGQAKYVACVGGSVLDVVLDVRGESPTFGAHLAVHLKSDLGQAIYVPEGVAHGCLALEQRSVVAYATSSQYQPEHEFSINPLDPELGIPWPRTDHLCLSDKDQSAPRLAQIVSSTPTLLFDHSIDRGNS